MSLFLKVNNMLGKQDRQRLNINDKVLYLKRHKKNVKLNFGGTAGAL